MRFIQKVSDREVDLEEIQENSVRPAVSGIWSADFASACTQSAEGFDEAWVSGLNETRNFKTFTQTEDEKQEEEKCDADFWENLQNEWERMAKDENADVPWLTDYDNLDIFKEYTYANDNPFIDQKGLRMLEKGDLPSAALAFEAAVQKNPEHVEAWQYLSSSQAKNEQDKQAIYAAKRSLELYPSNLNVLMSLAVSYTNESLPIQACKTLTKWLYHNPKYTHLVKPGMLDKYTPFSTVFPGDQHKATREAFIEAARMNPN
ncbi:UNVERIFIED_CONTAM: Peroxisomal targeting signal 1 receptor [Trichonephila clavipes]